MSRTLSRAVRALCFGAACLAAVPAVADKIKNPTAVFSGLDKITGRIVSFEVAVDETVQFGALQLTPRVCYSRPPTEYAKQHRATSEAARGQAKKKYFE